MNQKLYDQCIANGCTPKLAEMLASRQAPSASGFNFEPGDELVSSSLGVHPDQIPEASRLAKQAGVPVNFTPDGDVIFESYQHRDKYAKTIGKFSKSDKGGRPVKERSVSGGFKKPRKARKKHG